MKPINILLLILVLSISVFAADGQVQTGFNLLSIFGVALSSGVMGWLFFAWKNRKKIMEWKDAFVTFGNALKKRDNISVSIFIREFDEALEATADLFEKKGDKKHAQYLRDIIKLDKQEKVKPV